MTVTKLTTRTLAGMMLWAGIASAQSPTAADLLARKPVQPNVKVSMPTAPEASACKVEALNYPKGANAGRR